MNILMVTMSLGIGGAETHILELARELVRRGENVTVASAGGIFAETLIADGVHHVNVPLHSKHPKHMMRAYRALCALLREGSFDIIHAHARIPGFVASHAARRFDVPMVTTFHGTFNPVWYLRMLTRVGERTLAVSDDVKEYLMHYYRTPEEKIGITVNGIDTENFDTPSPEERAAVEAELSLPAGDRIMAVTRLDREAAQHIFRLIEAMPVIAAERPSATLTIVGGGDVLEEVSGAAAEMNARLGAKKITVVGPRSDIAHVLAAADIFVGVSRAAMEAMACRIPVVLSGAQGHLGVLTPALEAEAVQTNFCCRTREPADAETLGGAVLALLAASPEERREMGEFNRSIIERLYSVSRMSDDAQTLYRTALNTHLYRRADAVISGYYGFGNAGDDALLASIADGLREKGIRQIAALAKRGSCPAPGVRGVSRFNIPAIWHALRQAKLLISGGGSLLQDATSAKSLFYYTSVIRAAKLAGTPVMIYANGIGPIRRDAGRRRAAAAAAMADYISVRERASAEELCAMGVPRERIFVTADPVYRSAGNAAAFDPAARDYIVLSLRETADGQNADSVEDAAVRALTEVCRSRGLAAVLLPMQPKYDREICARAAVRLAEAGVEVREYPAATAEEMRAILRGARAAAAMRLHALIFATAEGVPSLALSYDPKLDALMDYLGMSEYVLPAFNADAQTFTEAFSRLLGESTEISARLTARTAELSALAEKDLAAAAEFFRS